MLNVLRKPEESDSAGYVRVSTEKVSQKESPEHQRMLIEEKAIMEDLNLLGFYEDHSSGTGLLDRKDMLKLLEDAEKGYFKVVLFASLSRFARNTADALNLRERLVDALGIRLISIEENYDSDVDGSDIMKFTLFSMLNEKVSNDISMSSRRGIRMSASKGNFTGSIAPFGYKKIKVDKLKTLEIVEEDAKIVHEIFDLYVNGGMGEKQICNKLNELKIPSPKGGVWGVTSVQRILQNEAYLGINCHGKYTVAKTYVDKTNMQTRTKKLVQKEKDKWIRNEERNWDAIISDDIFAEAQQIRLVRGGGKRGGVRPGALKVNPFAGVLFCTCGSSMCSMKSGKSGKNGQVYRYLVCSAYRRMGEAGCQNSKWINLEELKEELFEALKIKLEKSFSTINIEERIKQHASEAQKTKSLIDPEKEMEQIEKKMKRTRQMLFELRQDYKNDEIDEEQYEFEKEAIEADIAKLKKELEKTKPAPVVTFDEEKYRKEAFEAIEKLQNLEHDDVEEMNFRLRKIITKMQIDKNGSVKIYSPFGEL